MDRDRLSQEPCGCRMDIPTGITTHFCPQHDPDVERWCPSCHGYVKSVWEDGALICEWCGEELLKEAEGMRYLSSTFSPAMLSPGTTAMVRGANLDDVPVDCVSVVGHEVTAKILSTLLEREVAFNRASITLQPGDELWCVIPKFRADQAREFTREEVEAAGFVCYHVTVE